MGHLGTIMWTSALPQNGEALPLTWGPGPVSRIPKSTGASSLFRAAVKPPGRGLGVEGRAAKQRVFLLLLGSQGFLGMRTAWHETRGKVGSKERWLWC